MDHGWPDGPWRFRLFRGGVAGTRVGIPPKSGPTQILQVPLHNFLGLVVVLVRDLFDFKLGLDIRDVRPHPPEDHLRRDARRWRSRAAALLLGFQMQPLDRDQRG